MFEEENIVTLSQRAVEVIKKIILDNNLSSEYYLRIGIRNVECTGLSYSLGFEEGSCESDILISIDEIKIIFDPETMALLSGTLVDFIENEHGKCFVFHNPNEKPKCECGTKSNC